MQNLMSYERCVYACIHTHNSRFYAHTYTGAFRNLMSYERCIYVYTKLTLLRTYLYRCIQETYAR